MTAKPSSDIPSVYNAADVERRIYENWMAKDYFKAVRNPDVARYTIIMPPPNVTGELHLGHALEKAQEDALVRWRRMSGIPTPWLQRSEERRVGKEGRARRSPYH